MATDTFANSVAELYDLLASDAAGTPRMAGVNRVYDHEPANHAMAKPVAVTMSPAGMDPLNWQIALRVYCASDVSPAKAQTDIVTAVEAVDNMLFSSVFGPSAWAFDVVNDAGQIVAACILAVGRTDEA